MKRLFWILLCLCLLWGCGAPEPAEVTEATTPPAAEAPEPSLYDPLSEIERFTAGSVKAFPIGKQESLGLRRMGDNLLVFGWGELTCIDENQMRISAEHTKTPVIFPEDPAVQISSKVVSYFDDASRSLVFLDSGLREVRRVPLPEGATGLPALSADRKNLFYFTQAGLKTLNLDTGLERLIRQTSHDHQSITNLHRNDQILEYAAADPDGSQHTLFLDVTSGELLWETSEYISLHTEDDRYFATVFDASYAENLTGSGDSEPMMVYIPYLEVDVFPLLDRNLLITVARQEDSCIIDCYDLNNGTRSGSLTLPAHWSPVSIVSHSDNTGFWMLIPGGSEESDLLCLWDPTQNPPQDDTVYVGIRRTPETPDEFGLGKCAETAAELSEAFGVDILLWQEALEVQPWDYFLTGEYQVLPIREALEDLRTVLSSFPEGFFREAASEMGDGILRISLVREIRGAADSGALDNAVGVQFWDEDSGNPYLCLQIGHELETTLYHELFHVLESRIYSTCDAYDGWNRLNPEGFSYDFNYSQYHFRDDCQLISGDTRAFIDYYSMSFPKEDRARIMEYACMPGNEDYFRSDIMQQKLTMLCLGIREAYGLNAVTEAFLWEQYLNEPIHANT